MSKKSQTPKSPIDQIIARARTLRPSARADFLRRHSATEIAEIHAALVGDAKPKTPRPIIEKRILAALAEPAPVRSEPSADQPQRETGDARDASPPEPKPIDAATTKSPEGGESSSAPIAGTGDETSATHDETPAVGGDTRSEEGSAANEGDSVNAGASDGATTAETGRPESKADSQHEPRAPRERDPRLPAVGTVIIKKDRHGTERVRCTIVEGGVEYGGTTYKSISSAAMAAAKDLGLASKTQDGYAFWGLKKAATRTTAKKDPVESLQKAWDHYRERADALVKAATDESRPKLFDSINQHAAALAHLTGGAA